MTAAKEQTTGQIFTDKTAAEYIGGIEPRTIRSWRMTRGLPFLRVTPRVIRIRQSDLDSWLLRSHMAIIAGGAH